MTETTTAESNALVSLNLNLPAPTVVAEQVNKAFHTIYGKIEEEIAAFVPDVTTEKGRQAIASLAYKIARTKTGLDEAAKNVTADQKQIIDAVNAERSKMREDLDKLKATVRAPLDAWEEERQRQQEETKKAIARHDADCIAANGKPSQWIADTIGEIEHELYCEAAFGAENVERLEESKAATLDLLRGMLADAEKREAEAAELEQLRREKAEREEKERQEREAEEARKREEEEKRRQEEERERIAKEAAEKAEREALQKIEDAKREAAEATRRAEEAEARRIQAEKDAEAQRVYEAEQEQKRQIEAEERRQREAEEAKRREEEAAAKAEEEARRREEEAARKERERIQQEKAEEERQRLAQEKADQERAADLAHRKKVNSAATAAIMKAAGVSEADAQAIVIAIYKGQVPNVSISY